MVFFQENLKQLNFRPLNLDFLPLNDFEELVHPILMPLSNAEKRNLSLNHLQNIIGLQHLKQKKNLTIKYVAQYLNQKRKQIL